MNPSVLLATNDVKIAICCTAYAASKGVVVFLATSPRGLDDLYSALDEERLSAVIVVDSTKFDTVGRVWRDLDCGWFTGLIFDSLDDIGEVCASIDAITEHTQTKRLPSLTIAA